MDSPQPSTADDKARNVMTWVLGGFLVLGGAGLAVLALQPTPQPRPEFKHSEFERYWV